MSSSTSHDVSNVDKSDASGRVIVGNVSLCVREIVKRREFSNRKRGGRSLEESRRRREKDNIPFFFLFSFFFYF